MSRLAVTELVLRYIADRDDDCGNRLIAVPASVAFVIHPAVLAPQSRHQGSPTSEPFYLYPLNKLAQWAVSS